MLKHVVVDGSNIATEGRSAPSLHQLDEAVRAFLDEFDVENLSVVVDATFGHRIDKSERAEFDEAISANELVTPPAGAVGRGDAFVLQIASRVSATVLSNDSFQEFHGE
ncbi:MAG: Hsp70 family protein, partial [Acidimicrobiales bacterium]